MGLLDRLKPTPLTTFKVTVGNLVLRVQTEQGLEDVAKVSASKHWEVLQSYFTANPGLNGSPVSLPVLESAPAVVVRLSKASRQLGVLALQCLPGALVEAVASDLADLTPDVVVSTEGDFHVIGDRTRIFVVEPQGYSEGVAIRARNVGRYSIFLSRGRREVPTPMRKGAAIGLRAEHGAVASAVGSLMASKLADGPEIALSIAKTTPGITGALIKMDGDLSVWGEIEVVNPSEKTSEPGGPSE
jgi:ApbE superfamily uncharacterized protein (UPF0280 family)